MASLDPNALGLLIRWIHVGSMAVLLGGAVLLWALCEQRGVPQPAQHHRLVLAVAGTYEWVFWIAMGLVVITGVGNIGAFGRGLPGAQTTWGTILTVKLGIVLLLVVFSLVRTLLIRGLSTAGKEGSSTRPRIVVRGSYAGTLLLVAAVLTMGLVLAHG